MSSYINQIIAYLITFILALILGKFIIPELKKLHASQTEREELKEHKKKEGTPTMGGLIFIIASCVITFAFVIIDKNSITSLPVLLLAIGFGFIGFIDDYLKVVLKRPDGFKPKQKFILQFIFCLLFLAYLYFFTDLEFAYLIPFTSYRLNFGILTVPFLVFAIVGTVNGVNFTDGLDGLASSVTAVICFFFTVTLSSSFYGLSILSSVLLGALCAFLVYNVYPAKTFMGDTGSLFLGGFVAGISVYTGLVIYIIIFGFVYLAEVLSVIIQVTYFRKTGGKRIFRMAPIHHHYELGGMSETRIVYMFSLVTALLCIVSFVGISL